MADSKTTSDRFKLTMDELLDRLHSAVVRGDSDSSCLRLWSHFIRARDGYRCLLCGRAKGLVARHIFRKSFLPEARFMTGNGVALCGAWHVEAHSGFNGRADTAYPMDFQGGEKTELIAELFWDMAAESGRPRVEDVRYYFSDHVLIEWKMLQGFPWDHKLAGTPIEQAAYIWRGTPVTLAAAIIRANVFAG